MAGDWLKMEASTPDKHETLAITEAMGWSDPDLTVGKLFRVWRWFDQQTIDGNATGVTTALLDRVAGAPGFADAMASVGWLSITTTGLSLPNFDRHTGETAKARALTARRVSKFKSNSESNGNGNGRNVTPALASQLPREEKRREEKRRGSKKEREISTARVDRTGKQKRMSQYAFTAESAKIAAWIRTQPKRQSEAAFAAAFEAEFQKDWSTWCAIKRSMEPDDSVQ